MTKNKIFKSLVLAVLLAVTLFGAIISPRTASVQADERATAPPLNMAGDTVTAPIKFAIGGSEAAYVYDESGYRLSYNMITGMVFSMAGGVVYNEDSQPIFYDDTTQEFNDSLQRRLDLVLHSTSGLPNYYQLQTKDGGKMRTISLNDELGIVVAKANTDFNKGAAHEILVSRVWKKFSFGKVLLTLQRGEWEYYTVLGHKLKESYFDTKVNAGSMFFTKLIGGVGGVGWLIAGVYIRDKAGNSTDYIEAKFEPWGTLRDLLIEIEYLIEVLPPTAAMGEFALNPDTGDFLRDNRGSKIRIKDGYLIDVLGLPLVGADAYPLYWKEAERQYHNQSGEPLTYGANNTLVDKGGAVVRSPVGNILAGQNVYLCYMLDGITPIPIIGRTKNNGKDMVYYDLNGNEVDPDTIITFEFSVEDRKEKHPEEYLSWWEELLQDIKNFFAAIGGALKTAGIILLIALAALAVLWFIFWVWRQIRR